MPTDWWCHNSYSKLLTGLKSFSKLLLLALKYVLALSNRPKNVCIFQVYLAAPRSPRATKLPKGGPCHRQKLHSCDLGLWRWEAHKVISAAARSFFHTLFESNKLHPYPSILFVRTRTCTVDIACTPFPPLSPWWNSLPSVVLPLAGYQFPQNIRYTLTPLIW